MCELYPDEGVTCIDPVYGEYSFTLVCSPEDGYNWEIERYTCEYGGCDLTVDDWYICMGVIWYDPCDTELIEQACADFY